MGGKSYLNIFYQNKIKTKIVFFSTWFSRARIWFIYVPLTDSGKGMPFWKQAYFNIFESSVSPYACEYLNTINVWCWEEGRLQYFIISSIFIELVTMATRCCKLTLMEATFTTLSKLPLETHKLYRFVELP